MAKRFKGLSHFGMALAEILDEYTKDVDNAIKAGVPEAAEIFKKAAIKASPEDDEGAKKSPYGYYKDNWYIKEETSSKYHKYVGNAKTVPSKKHGNIPLINILEYSTAEKHKKSRHVDKAIKSSKDQIRNVFIKHLK